MRSLKIILSVAFFVSVVLGWALILNAAEPLFERGLAEYKAENYEEAVELFEKAYKETTDDPKLTYYLGLTHQEMKDFPEASRFFKETLRLDPKASDARFYLADALYNTGDYEGALNSIEAAIREDVKPAQSNYFKGLILVKLNKNEEAVSAFKRSEQIDPALKQQADFQIASIYMQEKEYKKANEIFKGLITIDPTTDWALFAKDYLDALEKAPLPYRLNLGFGYQYDDNVLAVPIDPSLVDIERQKDWKRIYSLFGEYTLYSSGHWNIKTSYSLNITQHNKSDYQKASGDTVFSQDTVTHGVSIMPSYNTEKSVTSLLLSYSYLEVDYAEYMQTFTAGPSYTFVIGGDHFGQVFLKYKKDEHDFNYLKIKYGTYPLMEEDRDANNFSAGLGYFYSFSKGNGLFNLKVEGTANNADGANWDYTGGRASVGLLYPFIDNKLKANIFAEFYHQQFSNVNSIYNIERRDDTITAQASLTYTILRPLDIGLAYAHVNDDSNIGVFAYRKNLYTASIEYRF
ncbi:MAG: tetratricopeptide repeat protein [Nitrospirae bacterium]|nr:tetratricopeptide repeat protein [Nitrospirota bacterium]